jgi:hypothetical protein
MPASSEAGIGQSIAAAQPSDKRQATSSTCGEHLTEAMVAELMGDLEERWHTAGRAGCPSPIRTREGIGSRPNPAHGPNAAPDSAGTPARPHGEHFRRQCSDSAPYDARVCATARAEGRNMGDELRD